MRTLSTTELERVSGGADDLPPGYITQAQLDAMLDAKYAKFQNQMPTTEVTGDIFAASQLLFTMRVNAHNQAYLQAMAEEAARQEAQRQMEAMLRAVQEQAAAYMAFMMQYSSMQM